VLSHLSQTWQTIWVLIIIVLAYVVADRFLRFGNPLAMLFAAVVGGLSSGFGLFDVTRHVVEGSFTFINIILIIYTATIFIYVQKESKALNALVRDVIIHFHNWPKVLVVLLMFLIMLPPAFTGPGADGIFAFGVLVSSVLMHMGVPLTRITAFIALGGTLGVFAPPVNVPAMIIAAGINMPYVGFMMPLLLATIPVAVFSALFLCWRYVSVAMDADGILKTLPPIPEKMKGVRVYLPMIVVVGLMLSARAFPHFFPHLGIPLIFVIGTILAVIMAGGTDFIKVSRDAFDDTFSINAILVAIGALVQVMSLTGVRGLFVLSAITVPSFLLYLVILIGFPLFAGILTSFGAASVFGVPFMLALLGRDPIIATVGLALISVIGNIIPPTAVLGKPAAVVAGYDESYNQVVKVSLVPIGVILVYGLFLVMFADFFRFFRF
jgi:gluconate:H+ symporter, GntP family